jgi:hypothetical protein
MVRNLCQLALLFSVQDHKQSLCHFIFYIYINYLVVIITDKSGKAANDFRLLASRRQSCSSACRLPLISA